MTERIRRFIRQRGPGLLFLLLILLVFIGFMFSRGGLDIDEPDYQALSPHQNEAVGTISEIYDGDTIKVNLTDKDKSVVVRILGMDCPESSRNEKCQEDGERGWMDCEEQIPLGKRATRVAKDLLAGDTVTLKSGTNEGFKTGSYGRALAYVHMPDGTDFGLEMVKRGQCRDFSHAFDHPRMETYQKHNRPIKPLDGEKSE